MEFELLRHRVDGATHGIELDGGSALHPKPDFKARVTGLIAHQLSSASASQDVRERSDRSLRSRLRA